MDDHRSETKIIVLGAGGTGMYMGDIIRATPGCQLEGFLDDDTAGQVERYCGCPILGPLTNWPQLPDDWLFISSLYGAKNNDKLARRVRSLDIPDSRWATVIDLRATVSGFASVGPGTFVGPGTVVEPRVTVGRRCALLGNVYLAHDTKLGDDVACANSASLAGGVVVGDASFIGANAAIREYTRIGAGAIVGIGSVVLHDVMDGCTVVGNPARPRSKEAGGAWPV